MKRGRKPVLPREKAARGTIQPCRDAGKVTLIEPDALPVMPDWLTDDGRQVWLDEIGRVSATRLANERDSLMFATFCNLAGACAAAWRAGAVPPASHLVEMRKQAELFGLAGARSRMNAPAAPKENPFAKFAAGQPPIPHETEEQP